MTTRIQIEAHEGVNKGLSAQIRIWAEEALENPMPLSLPPRLHITIWRTMEEFQAFYQREKQALGVTTGEESDFLATHDAWRGYPSIHICQERIVGIPAPIVQGVVHHEIGHALHHGTPEFYTFRFSKRLQETGKSYGLNLALLEQLIYFLSVAIKDWQVVQWLSEIGLGFSQRALIEHLISDTEEEQESWQMVRGTPGLRKIALAAFLKTLLPIVAMITAGVEGAQELRFRWNWTYGWLSEGEKESLSRFARYIAEKGVGSFQESLERACLRLITEPSL